MWDKVGAKNWRRPLLLAPGNFTPPTRTPWGGTRIVEGPKRDFGFPGGLVVGEAWELSVEPDFPSTIDGGPALDALLRADAGPWLGREEASGSTALLVKLLDAADDLSVQIHPTDDDPRLTDDQSGKPEAWYIIEADEGAGLYLGFVDGVGRDDVERAIANGDDVSALMQFVPVAPGDAFVIEPGTPHAVGRGVMLLEPQRVIPGKRGITYRYWDWNRRYDPKGRPDPNGAPRALHLADALDVTRWDGPRQSALLSEVHHRIGPAERDGDAVLEPLIGPAGPLASSTFDVRRLSGTGTTSLPDAAALRSLTVLEGQVCIAHEAGNVTVPQGQTAALPACLPPTDVTLDAAHAVVCHLA